MDNLFFVFSKVLWEMLNPQSLLLFMLLLATFWLWTARYKAARNLLTFIAVMATLISVMPFKHWLLYPLESRFDSQPNLPEVVDGIIVLGGSITRDTSEYWQQVETNDAHERLAYGVMLALQYPQAKLLFSGGIGSLNQNQANEAQFAEQYLLAHGINPDRLIIENKSRNTHENGIFSQQLIRPKPSEQWILVTSAYHMPRSVGIFCQLGWPVIPYPVDHYSNPNLFLTPDYNLLGNANDLLMASKEWIGLVAYYLKGYTGHLFPQGCR